MKNLLLFITLAVALVAAPTTPINNANIQLNGVSQTGVLAGQSTGAATATGAQISTALDLLGSTRGSVLYRGASGWSILGPGTSGYVLTTAGAGADPTWAVNAGGDVVGPASSTLNAWPLFADTTGKLLKNSDVTYSSPTLSVPDAFVVSSAGSIGLTAGGSNKNVTITPSGTGYAQIGGADANGNSSDFDILVSEKDTSSHSYGLMTYANSGFFRFWRANGTYASPTALANDDSIGGLAAGGRDNAGWSGATGLFSFNAQGAWTTTSRGTDFRVQTTNNGTTSRVTNLWVHDYGGTTLGFTAGSRTAWGVTGVNLEVPARTITDSTSSGTVATAVANSFAVPTFAASSATTFTNAANLYIAGGVANGTNVTLTNSYGLWNVGKTRLDSGIYLGGTTPGVIAGSSGAITLTANGTNQNIALTPSGTGDVVATGTDTFFISNSTGTFGGFRWQKSGIDRWSLASNASGDLVMSRFDTSGVFQNNEIAMATDGMITIASGGVNQNIVLTPIGTGALVVGSGDGASRLIGGAGNMTITAGTGASRTLSLQTTTSGSVATTAIQADASQGVRLGGQSALATNATDGFVYIRGGAGTPTGAPTAVTGLVPLYVDTTNNKLYFYTNGAWRDAGP